MSSLMTSVIAVKDHNVFSNANKELLSIKPLHPAILYRFSLVIP